MFGVIRQMHANAQIVVLFYGTAQDLLRRVAILKSLFVYAGAQFGPRMYVTVQNRLRRSAIYHPGVFGAVKRCPKAMVQIVSARASVRASERSDDYIDGLLDQMKRVSK